MAYKKYKYDNKENIEAKEEIVVPKKTIAKVVKGNLKLVEQKEKALMVLEDIKLEDVIIKIEKGIITINEKEYIPKKDITIRI